MVSIFLDNFTGVGTELLHMITRSRNLLSIVSVPSVVDNAESTEGKEALPCSEKPSNNQDCTPSLGSILRTNRFESLECFSYMPFHTKLGRKDVPHNALPVYDVGNSTGKET